jgi:hypothetical protein
MKVWEEYIRLNTVTDTQKEYGKQPNFVNFIGKYPETSFYLGGIVRAVNGTDILTITYDVTTPIGKFRNVKSSDLRLYAIGEDVFILKKYDGVLGQFFWRDISYYKNWVIVPVNFQRS